MSDANEALVQVSELTKAYEGRVVLDSVSLDFARGAVTSLLGPSGCGKSTLLRCIDGLETFDAGTIHVGGDPLHAGRPSARSLAAVRRRVGFVFQQFCLFAHRTALENVTEGPIHVRKKSPAEAVDRARALLARVGLSHREHAFPHEMSGGEQQRVAIARALAMDPEVLLLDEPTSALDPSRRGEVRAVLRELAETGMTMLLVTHEMAFAREVSQRVLFFHERGEIVADGTPDEVLDPARDPRIAAFLDEG